MIYISPVDNNQGRDNTQPRWNPQEHGRSGCDRVRVHGPRVHLTSPRTMLVGGRECTVTDLNPGSLKTWIFIQPEQGKVLGPFSILPPTILQFTRDRQFPLNPCTTNPGPWTHQSLDCHLIKSLINQRIVQGGLDCEIRT